jgi:hypothetical protein
VRLLQSQQLQRQWGLHSELLLPLRSGMEWSQLQ